jgi:flagellar assembly factor FliW
VWLRSPRFGDYEVPMERVLWFPQGLIGFAEARRFALLDSHRPNSPFRCLVCLDDPDLGFVVCDPDMLRPGYASELPVPEHAQREDVAVLAIVTVPANALEMTVNLMAPLLVDCRTRTGRQLVIDTGRYSTRHPIL